jgi:GNAT superfamily N-acetyltransferase
VTIQAAKVPRERIDALRRQFLDATRFQLRYFAVHERGSSDCYVIAVDGVEAGFGSIKGQEIPDRDTVFEFYVRPPFADSAREMFVELLRASQVMHIECQSNDDRLTSLLLEFGRNIRSDVVLFEDHSTTNLSVPGALVRTRRPNEAMFDHNAEPEGDYVVEVEGAIVASGGFLLHYNPPFADLYMETRPEARRRGYASLLLQEVKKACYEAGRVPAARTSLDNYGSRATLTKAGMRICGFMLLADVAAPAQQSTR